VNAMDIVVMMRALGLSVPRSLYNTRTDRELSRKNLRVDCRRCLQCLTALPVRARPDQRFCCRPCHTAWWRNHGSVRSFERRHGKAGIAVILAMQSEFLTGDTIPDRRLMRRRRGKDGRFCRLSDVPVKPPESPMRWDDYKKLHNLDQRLEPIEPRPKRRHGVGCRYKPMGKSKQSSSARDYGLPPRGSQWSA